MLAFDTPMAHFVAAIDKLVQFRPAYVEVDSYVERKVANLVRAGFQARIQMQTVGFFAPLVPERWPWGSELDTGLARQGVPDVQPGSVQP